MATVYDVKSDELIRKAASDLKENISMKMPDWAMHVKTGVHKQKQPEDPDWWFARSAAILRKVYVDGPVGVQRLRTVYGGRKHRGVKPEEFRRAGGKIIRTILKDLDALGFTEKSDRDGRKITAKGRKYLDALSTSILKK
ncbi:MAG: 30S ribosomal protein S19e [Candidatus Altiarchaeota archaeon]|nr:30S ribosomal protein S19e [Candidatus Altiarchaeota archaeon]